MLQLPCDADNVCPCTAEPLTTGNPVFTGGAVFVVQCTDLTLFIVIPVFTGGDTTVACTTVVCADVADPDPPAFDAVTTTRTVEFTSDAANT